MGRELDHGRGQYLPKQNSKRRPTSAAPKDTPKSTTRRQTVNVNVISPTALIRNRVSRRVLHVSKITWGILYLFQEAQTH